MVSRRCHLWLRGHQGTRTGREGGRTSHSIPASPRVRGVGASRERKEGGGGRRREGVAVALPLLHKGFEQRQDHPGLPHPYRRCSSLAAPRVSRCLLSMETSPSRVFLDSGCAADALGVQRAANPTWDRGIVHLLPCPLHGPTLSCRTTRVQWCLWRNGSLRTETAPMGGVMPKPNPGISDQKTPLGALLLSLVFPGSVLPSVFRCCCS